MKTFLAAAILVTGSVAISLPAFAGNTDADMWKLFQGAPKITGSGGNYWKLRGRFFWDGAQLSETPGGGIENTFEDSEFRAVRIGVEGKYGD
ncbi:MAG: hypothetical protein L3J05_04595, partial [Robiginitomaculum sp.]|nr:hypothetical protein [Robiginitomaculum sp.]